MEFILKLYSKLDHYRVATFITYIGKEALDIQSGQ